VHATVALREAVRPGSVFLIVSGDEDSANALTNGLPRTVEVRRA
jgi:hypothetical protein